VENHEMQKRLPPVEQTFLHAFLRYVAVLLRYKWFIIGVTGLVGGIALALCVASILLPAGKNPMPNEFTAEATILVQQNPSNDLTANIISAVALGNQEASAPLGFEYSALLLRMLRSRVIIDQVLEDFSIGRRYKLAGAPKSRERDLLLGRMRFGYTKTTGILSISYHDTDPRFASEIVNRMVYLLEEWFTTIWGTSSEKQRQLLQQKLNEVSAQVASLEDQLKALQKKYGFLTTQDLGVSQTQTLAGLRSQLILKEMEIRNYAGFAREQDPHLQQLNAERQNILDLIQQVQKGTAETSQFNASQQDLPEVAQQYANLSQQISVRRGIYETLSHQYEMAKLSIQPTPSFQVLEMAEVPDHKSGPNRVMLFVTDTLFALAGSIVVSFIVNAVRKAHGDPEARRILREASQPRQARLGRKA
jgi:tyrosine-protein kinase Etk/Wzc